VIKFLRYLLAAILVALIVRLLVDLFIFQGSINAHVLTETVVFAAVYGLVFLLFSELFHL